VEFVATLPVWAQIVAVVAVALFGGGTGGAGGTILGYLIGRMLHKQPDAPPPPPTPSSVAVLANHPVIAGILKMVLDHAHVAATSGAAQGALQSLGTTLGNAVSAWAAQRQPAPKP
jgi:hypothetical protein